MTEHAMPRPLLTLKSRRPSPLADAPSYTAQREVGNDHQPVVPPERGINARLVGTDTAKTGGLETALRRRPLPGPAVPPDGHAQGVPERAPRTFKAPPTPR